MKSLLLSFAVAVLLSNGANAAAQKGTVSENIRIESHKLGYALQYRIYTPPNYEPDQSTNLPTLYVTDGQWYLERGQFAAVLDEQIQKGSVRPVVTVFVDNRNPDNLRENRRNNQFFCVTEYADFFRSELVPAVNAQFNVSHKREDRVILGLSFGGLNAGCFGIMAHDVFGGIAMQSPAMHPVPSLYQAYAQEPRRPIKVFLSVGDENEITKRSKRLKVALEKKGYPLLYKKNSYGHNWENWRPLLDDVLKFFYTVPD